MNKLDADAAVGSDEPMPVLPRETHRHNMLVDMSNKVFCEDDPFFLEPPFAVVPKLVFERRGLAWSDMPLQAFDDFVKEIVFL